MLSNHTLGRFSKRKLQNKQLILAEFRNQPLLRKMRLFQHLSRNLCFQQIMGNLSRDIGLFHQSSSNTCFERKQLFNATYLSRLEQRRPNEMAMIRNYLNSTSNSMFLGSCEGFSRGIDTGNQLSNLIVSRTENCRTFVETTRLTRVAVP